MSVHMAQARVKPEHVTDLQAAADKMFAAIDAAQPDGVRYAWSVLADGETFVALVQVDDGLDNPIPRMPEFQELQAQTAKWIAGPAGSQPLTVIGSYRLF
jgi:hypothetical protein